MTKKQISVCLDAGHYGKYNRSPVVPDYYESDMVWKLHLMQKEILERYGCRVITTRDNQSADRGLYDRGYTAKGCDLFISDHSNACSTESVDYPVVYRAYDNINNCNELALKLAEAVAAVMGTAQAGRTAVRQGTSGEYYGVLRGARAAGLSNYYIVEHSFHTNQKATLWLRDDANLRELAEAECRVIAEYYGLTDKTEEGKEAAEQETVQEQQTAQESGVPYTVTTTCDALNIRAGAGTVYPVVGTISEKAGEKKQYTIVEEKDGWGRLKSGAGWISLSYTSRTTSMSGGSFVPYTITTTCDALNIRLGAGADYPIMGTICEKDGKKNQYTIVKEKDGWGMLKSGIGWIKLSYTKRAS